MSQCLYKLYAELNTKHFSYALTTDIGFFLSCFSLRVKGSIQKKKKQNLRGCENKNKMNTKTINLQAPKVVRNRIFGFQMVFSSV